MERSAIFSGLLNMDGYGQMDSHLSSAIISNIADWWGKLANGGIRGENLQTTIFGNDLYKFVQKYASLVQAAFPDEACLPVDSPENKYNLSLATQKWEMMARLLMADTSHTKG